MQRDPISHTLQHDGNARRQIPFKLSGCGATASAVFLTILSSVIAYSNTLHSPFLLDDFGNIVYNSAIELEHFSWDGIRKIWFAPQIEGHRKLSYLTFALNYWWNGYHPFGFHIVNIAIHIACTLSVFFFFHRALSIGWLSQKYGPDRLWLAVGAAMVWGLNPIQINAVTYIVQRMTSLAAFFAMVSMTFWLWGRKQWFQQCRGQAIICWVFAFASWCMGLLSKEHVAIVPLLIMVHEFFLLRKGEGFPIKWPWLALGAMALVVPAFYFLGSDPVQRILGGYASRDFTLTERLMTESRVLWHYLSLFFIPISERFSLFYEYPVSKGIFAPVTTFLSIVAWIGMMLSVWINRKKYPVFAWMAAWFLVAHLIESTVIPLEIVFEHRMYLPSVGIALGAVLIGFDVLRARTERRWISVFALSVVLCILSIATYTRNMDFKDEVTLYRSEVKKFPDSNRNRLGLALALNKVGRFREGGEMLQEMAEAYPNDLVLQQNWYNFLIRLRKDPAVADGVYLKILNIIHNGFYDPRHDAMALKNLSELFFEIGDYKRALLMVDRLLMDYRKASFFLLKGISHAKLEESKAALQAFEEAFRRQPEDINMMYWYGKSLVDSGEKDKGCLILTTGSQQKSGNQKVRLLCQKMLDAACGGVK